MHATYTHINNVLVFFNTKFLLEGNNTKADALRSLLDHWNKVVNRIETLDPSSKKIASLIKSDFHAFILELKNKKKIYAITLYEHYINN